MTDVPALAHHEQVPYPADVLVELADLLHRLRDEGTRAKIVYTISAFHNPTGATLSLARATLDRVLLGLTTLEQAAEAGDLTVEGDPEKIRELLGLLDDFEFWFDIVTP